ncbi:hypothetical protein B0T18DRAFT_219268 [Schizothecium vesticola]|uniref:Uncharacterized protein n=1 Tax=Schizothecium vesticola TaxID=314040 RepID=A0AA40EKA8_9PEZI|nr:hypothetical protein B0T18DRAFT_219268 [Schizothecium vesticola]
MPGGLEAEGGMGRYGSEQLGRFKRSGWSWIAEGGLLGLTMNPRGRTRFESWQWSPSFSPLPSTRTPTRAHPPYLKNNVFRQVKPKRGPMTLLSHTRGQLNTSPFPTSPLSCPSFPPSMRVCSKNIE